MEMQYVVLKTRNIVEPLKVLKTQTTDGYTSREKRKPGHTFSQNRFFSKLQMFYLINNKEITKLSYTYVSQKI